MPKILEKGTVYRTYNLMVGFIVEGGYRVGYIEIPEDNPVIQSVDFSDLEIPMEITYQHFEHPFTFEETKSFWIGIDYDHLYDKPDLETAKKYGATAKNIEYIEKMNKIKDKDYYNEQATAEKVLKDLEYIVNYLEFVRNQ